jgi:hypothetical protein
MMKTTDQLDPSCANVGADAQAQIRALAAEVADLRRQLQGQAQVLAELQAECEGTCCPWHAQPWHRDHASRATLRDTLT